MGLTNLMYKNIHFDSDEEVFVAMWLEEMKQAGFIQYWLKPVIAIPITPGHKIKYTKKTKLKTKTKIEVKEKIILRPSEYTPDFQVKFTEEGIKNFITDIKYHISTQQLKPKNIFYEAYPLDIAIEVKPVFDMQNMERGFIHKQKYLWDKSQLFVNLVEPLDLFKKTFLPLQAEPYFRYKKLPKKALAAGKTVGDFKFDWKPKTINEFLES